MFAKYFAPCLMVTWAAGVRRSWSLPSYSLWLVNNEIMPFSDFSTLTQCRTRAVSHVSACIRHYTCHTWDRFLKKILTMFALSTNRYPGFQNKPNPLNAYHHSKLSKLVSIDSQSTCQNCLTEDSRAWSSRSPESPPSPGWAVGLILRSGQ